MIMKRQIRGLLKPVLVSLWITVALPYSTLGIEFGNVVWEGIMDTGKSYGITVWGIGGFGITLSKSGFLLNRIENLY